MSDERAREAQIVKPMRRLAIIAATLAVYGLARLIFNAIGLRTIGAESVGRVNLALSFAVLISLPATAGVVPTLSRYLPLVDSHDSAAAAKLHRWALGMALAGTLPAALVFLALHGAGLLSSYGAAVTVMAILWTALYSLYAICRAELFVREDPVASLWLELAGFGLFAVCVSFMVAMKGISWLPFTTYYWPAAGYVLIRLWSERSRRANLPFPASALRRFGLYALLGSLASLGITYLSTVVVSVGSGLAAAGFWASLMSLATPLLLAPRTLNSSFLPKLSMLGRRSMDAFHRLSAAHQRFSSLTALGSVGVALLLARPALALLVGTRPPDPGGGEGQTDTLLASWRMICVASWGIFRGEPMITATAALGRSSLTALGAFSGALLCLMIWLALLPQKGLPGVAAGYMVFALATPSIVTLVGRLRRTDGPVARVSLFASDGFFALVAVLSLMGVTERTGARALALAVLLAVIGHGGWRMRREIESAYAPLAASDAAPPAAGVPETGVVPAGD